MSDSPWSTVLTRAEINAQHALTASLDPVFARDQRAFYESRTQSELQALAAQAWNCCDPTSYQMAMSYAALETVI